MLQVVGVDIDKALVARARRLVSSTAMRQSAIRLTDASFIPMSFWLNYGPAPSAIDNVRSACLSS